MRPQGEIRAKGRPVGDSLEGDEATEVLSGANPPEIMVASERRQPRTMDQREQRPRLATDGVLTIETGEQTTVRRRLERGHDAPHERIVEQRLP